MLTFIENPSLVDVGEGGMVSRRRPFAWSRSLVFQFHGRLCLLRLGLGVLMACVVLLVAEMMISRVMVGILVMVIIMVVVVAVE